MTHPSAIRGVDADAAMVADPSGAVRPRECAFRPWPAVIAGDEDVAVLEDTYHVVGKTGRCPECGHALRAVFDGEATNLLCLTCGICWHDELGWITRVNPKTCPGCSLHGVCTGAQRRYGAPVPD